MGELMPAVFMGHGNPMHALRSNHFTEGWRRLGSSLPKPNAILAISAHWYGEGISVTGSALPETIHDFYGFPQELFEVTYPAPGSPGLAERVRQLLQPHDVLRDDHRGLDHGVWSLLCHLFPDAGIPVVQLSIDSTKEASFHFEAGRCLRPLRDEGVLVLGSGNIVHNLRAYRWDGSSGPPFDWAARFEAEARRIMVEGNGERLVDYLQMGQDARLASPTPDHFLPLLYILGLQARDEPVSFPVEGIEGGSLSMLSVKVG
ncbi:MAG: 4,5-DOPA dioxygenase extradiol [Chlorobiaceae bacterium]|nr:4,5-DOPA dioxygenase extradiol [Chlorobiaceae bacterium]